MSDQVNLDMFAGGDWEQSGQDGYDQVDQNPGNPSESLFAYSIDQLDGNQGAEESSYRLGDAFAIRPQTVESQTSSPILSGGEHFTIVGQTDVQTYIGTATDAAAGKVVGFIFEDATTGKYFLFSKDPDLESGMKLNLNASSGPGDLHNANWNLSTGSPVTCCFLAGTAVMTPDGEVTVEILQPGDKVVLSDGRVAPISWLGVQTVSTRFADPLRVLPIRIAAGALADGLPKRDLLVSRDHAILLDGLLVQAGAMVNGLSITREPSMPEIFRYYHVEVADHSCILAEGVPAETFVDNVSRMAFDNWKEHTAPASVQEMGLPRVKFVRQLPSALRGKLQAQAAKIARPGVAA